MKDEYSHDFDFVRYSDWREHTHRYNDTADQRENADPQTFRDDYPAGDSYQQEDDYPQQYDYPPENGYVQQDDSLPEDGYVQQEEFPEGEYPPEEDYPPQEEWNDRVYHNDAPEWTGEPEPAAYGAPAEPMMDPQEYQQEYEFDRERALEQIRLARIKRERADQLARDRLHAEIFLVVTAIVIVMLVVALIYHVTKKKKEGTTFTITSAAPAVPKEDLKDLSEPMDEGDKGGGKASTPATEHEIVEQSGITYVDGIMIVNKTYGLPSTYQPGLDPECEAAFGEMATAAWNDGLSIWMCSGYRSYAEQDELFDSYATARGLAGADEVSARPGHSEHQTGLSIDVNTTDFTFADTPEAQWLEEHCAEYGFIIRFPKGKEKLTGYEYEPWHIRYVGRENAQKIKASGKCLEEYLGVTSDYELSPDNETFKKKYAEYADTSSEDTESYSDGYTDYGYGDGYTDYNYDNGYNDYNTYDYGYNDGYTDYNTYDYNYGY